MLFVFDAPALLAFSMEDTFVPLDIIFLDARGTVTKVARGTPRSKQRHVANARGVLEVCAGSGIEVGQKVGVRVVSHYTLHPEGIGQSTALAAKRRALAAASGASGNSGAGASGASKFPVIPVAIGAAVLAVVVLLRRK